MIKHPAIMGQHILNECKKHLPFKGCRILDPFAGIGTTAKCLPDYDVVGIEIEEEWANQHSTTICGDSKEIIPTLGKFDVVLTSPTYGNRMADDFKATNQTGRITYRHKLGHSLSRGTTANLHFNRKNQRYETLHQEIWRLCVEALNDNGLFILNCKDFIANNKIQQVTKWHIETLETLGMKVISQSQVNSKGMRFGANREKRIDYENVVVLEKTL